MKGDNAEGGDPSINADDEEDIPRTCCTKCAKVLEIAANILGVLFICAAMVVGINDNPYMFKS